MTDQTTKTVRDIEITDESKLKTERIRIPIFKIVQYTAWPQFILNYHAYMEWADGNDDRTSAARKKLWIAFVSFAFSSLAWWMVFFSMRDWPPIALFTSALYILAVWILFCIPMNFFSLAAFKIPDFTAFKAKRGKPVNYLQCNERIVWTEFPEPQEEKFVLGTAGKDWIQYGWNPPIYEKGFAVIGELGKGRANAVNYLIACGIAKADTICFCLDGKPASGVGFRHLRGLKHVHIAEDYETIIKTAKWLNKILIARLNRLCRSTDDVNFPRILIVCDEEISQTFLPGIFNKEKQLHAYRWPAIHRELIAILHNGKNCDMHIVATLEPSESLMSLDSNHRPYFEEINLFFSLPRESEDGKVIWITPHHNPYLDVFAVRMSGEKIVGKLPFIPEKELAWWIAEKSKAAGDATSDLWDDTLEKLPKETIGEKVERDELIWLAGKLIQKSRIESGEYRPEKIDLGAREEFHQLHHASKNGNVELVKSDE